MSKHPMERSNDLIRKIKDRDFGTVEENFQGIKLGCTAVAPGLTMYDLVQIYEHEAKRGDDLSGNSANWPTVKGINAVLDAVFDALAKDLEDND